MIYSALHNPSGVCGKIVTLGATGSFDLYSIDLAREELHVNLERKMNMNVHEVELIILSLPIQWIPRDAYSHELRKAIQIVGNQPDAAFLAASLATGIPLVTGDKGLQTQNVQRFARTYRPHDFANLAAPE